VAGLQWVFPSFKRDFGRCSPRFDTSRDTSLRSWFCPVAFDAGNGISYTVWVTADAAQKAYDAQYTRKAADFVVDGRTVGLRWWRSERNADGFLKMTVAFDSLPFSSSIYASTRAGLERVCSLLTVRSQDTFAVRPPECQLPAQG